VQDLCRIAKKTIRQQQTAQRLLMGCIMLRSQCGMAYGIGRGRIRTYVTIAGESVFETDAFGHSATLPKKRLQKNKSGQAFIKLQSVN
jgi:hypothetical protein